MRTGQIHSYNMCPEIIPSEYSDETGIFLQTEELKNINSEQLDNASISHSNVDFPKIEEVIFNSVESVPFNMNFDPKPKSYFDFCQQSNHLDFCYNCGEHDTGVFVCKWCCKFYENTAKSFEDKYNESKSKKIEYLVEPSTGINETEDECLSSTESEYYEDIVVDEDKRSLKFPGYFLEGFLNLMDAMKHLPIETQNTIILHYIEDRRKLISKQGTGKLKIPYYDKIWNFCQVFLNDAYHFARDYVLFYAIEFVYPFCERKRNIFFTYLNSFLKRS